MISVTSLEEVEKIERLAKAENKTIAPKQPYKIDTALEQRILEVAKSSYQDWHDVKRLADELGIRAGIVYNCLKYHNFIRQNETAEYRVLDAYFRCNGNLGLISKEAELGVWICSEVLKKYGFSPNWQSYKDRKNSKNVGDEAEELFLKFVPDAVDMNGLIKENHPDFDFMVNGKTIDVKSSRLQLCRGKAKSYSFRLRHKIDDELPDFFCVFLCEDREKKFLGKYHCLLIPKEVLPDKQLQLSILPQDREGTYSFLWQFKIEPVTLPFYLGLRQ